MRTLLEMTLESEWLSDLLAIRVKKCEDGLFDPGCGVIYTSPTTGFSLVSDSTMQISASAKILFLPGRSDYGRPEMYDGFGESYESFDEVKSTRDHIRRTLEEWANSRGLTHSSHMRRLKRRGHNHDFLLTITIGKQSEKVVKRSSDEKFSSIFEPEEEGDER